MAVNDGWRLLPTCDHLYCCDHRWIEYHLADVARDYDGHWWTQDKGWPKSIDPEQWGLKVLASVAKPGLSTTPGLIHQGMNSGFQAINLATNVLGATHVYLLGYDLGPSGGRSHFFGDHPKKIHISSPYAAFIKQFQTIDPARYGVEIINVSRTTNLHHFPKMRLEDI